MARCSKCGMDASFFQIHSIRHYSLCSNCAEKVDLATNRRLAYEKWKLESLKRL
ncbi:hypothetical protein GX563_00930 [Candidatus Bathyarchaeota archaeon]|nr:hypothetical protein [Candidatus Bathyarchaeota archaeon]